jgi:polysaccharide chain length determinant protein (PEP-CTERM system associated)
MTAEEKARQVRMDTEIERVDPVTLEPLNQSNAFSLHYYNPDAQRAAAVADRLAEMFLAYNQQTRTEAAEEARGFLQQQSTELAAEVKTLDLKLAEFKKQHGDTLPEAQARNLGAVDRIERDLAVLEAQIRAGQERESALTLQLNQISPTLAAATTDWRTELATLKSQLADAEFRYTPDHPDVKRLRKAVAAMIAQHAGDTAQNPTVVPDNPEYIQIQGQRDAARRELAALQASAARARSQIGGYQGRLAAAPEVEPEYVELTRQRDLIQSQFLEIQAKLRQAELAQNLESEQYGERFTLIRSPSIPDTPFSPNRLGWILIGLLLGILFGAAAMVIREMTDTTVHSVSELSSLSPAPVLATVPLIMTDESRRHRRRVWGLVSAAYSVAIVIVVIAVLTSGE